MCLCYVVFISIIGGLYFVIIIMGFVIILCIYIIYIFVLLKFFYTKCISNIINVSNISEQVCTLQKSIDIYSNKIEYNYKGINFMHSLLLDYNNYIQYSFATLFWICMKSLNLSHSITYVKSVSKIMYISTIIFLTNNGHGYTNLVRLDYKKKNLLL